MTRYVVVTDDSTRPEIAEAIAHLRAKAKTCRAEEIRAEIDADVDELVEQWCRVAD